MVLCTSRVYGDTHSESQLVSMLVVICVIVSILQSLSNCVSESTKGVAMYDGCSEDEQDR